MDTCAAAKTTLKTFKGVCWSCGVNLHVVDDLAADVAQTIRQLRSIADEPEEISSELERAPGFQECLPLISTASDRLMTDLLACHDCLRSNKQDIFAKVKEAEEENAELARCVVEDSIRLEAAVCELEDEERNIRRELDLYDCEEQRLQKELEQIRLEEDRLLKCVDDFWLKVSEHQLDTDESREEHAQIASATRYKTAVLERLSRTNVLNDMFHIAQDGAFVTINNFRMGHFPEQPVEWDEIDAAWGQACLLLDALIKKYQLPITKYVLKPKGSFSAIEVGGDVLQLHSSRDRSATSDHSMYSHSEQQRRFDRAMVSFLECLEIASVALGASKPSLPFEIKDCKVAGFSIRLQLNQDYRWTKALKYMLIDLKLLIGFLESRSS